MTAFGISDSSVQVDFPTHRPTRATVAARQNRLPCRCIDDGVDVLGDLVAGIDTHQVRHMAVRLVGLRGLRRVFPLTQQRQSIDDLGRRAFVEFSELISEVRQERIDIRGQSVDVAGDEFVPSQQRAVEQVPNELLRVGGSVLGAGSVLGRPLTRTFVGAVFGQNETFQPIFAASFHRRPRLFEQEFRVERVAIVLPEVHTIPRIRHGVVLHKVRACAVDVVFGRQRPALRLSGDILRISAPLRTFASLAIDVFSVRQMEFAQVRHLGRPVVHLHVDVRVNISVPWRCIAVVPNTLQVVGQHHAATARNEQIATVGKIDFLEQQVVGLIAGKCADEVRCRRRVRSRRERQRAAVVERFIIGFVSLGNGLVALVGRCFHAIFDIRGQKCRIVDVFVVARVEIRHSTKENDHFVGTRHGDAVSRSRDGSALRHHAHLAIVTFGLHRTNRTATRNGAAERSHARRAVHIIRRCHAVLIEKNQRSVDFSALRSLVAHSHHIVGIGSDVFALVLHAARGVAHASLRLVEVEPTTIVGRSGCVGGCNIKMSEIQVRTVGTIAHDAVQMAFPQRFVVELDVVATHTAENRTTKLTVTNRQRRGHPVRSGLRVPQRMLVRRLPRRSTRNAHFRHIGRLRVGEFHIGLGNEFQRIVHVALRPTTQFLSSTGTTPLVQVGIRHIELIDIDFKALVLAVRRRHDFKSLVACRRVGSRLETVALVVHHLSALRREAIAATVGRHLPELRLLLVGSRHSGEQLRAFPLRGQHRTFALHLDEIPKLLCVGAHLREHRVCRCRHCAQQAEHRHCKKLLHITVA